MIYLRHCFFLFIAFFIVLTLIEKGKTQQFSTILEGNRIDPQQLKEKMDKGERLVIVDVRNANNFSSVHIKGAISIPLNEMENRFSQLPLDREIILY